MSNQLSTSSLLDAIRAAVVAAWPAMPISYGRPRTPLTAPYCVIRADSVQVDFRGAAATLGNTNQANAFTILGRFPFPTDPTQIIELQRVTLANDLIAQLQLAETFAGTGMQPIVASVEWSDSADPNERMFDVALKFSVITQASLI